MKIRDTRQSAPSFKALASIGQRPVRGQRPSGRVIVATDAQGRDWQLNRLFGSHEISTATALQRKIEAAGEINPAHWRLAHGEY